MPDMKPMLFNTDMVRALLGNRKTVTRRVVKPQPPSETHPNLFVTPPYRPGDILYVRETFCNNGDYDLYPFETEKYLYKADEPFKDGELLPEWFRGWHPSIHMPREAARIFLRVTGVRVERLRDISLYDVWDEGTPQMPGNEDADGAVGHEDFAYLWDSTVKPADRVLYGWDANPWVFVISFEKISKEEANQT